MARRFSNSFIDDCFADEPRAGLVRLHGVLTSAPQFDLQKSHYGLPVSLFVQVGTLAWEACARSGIWTYYESVALHTQSEMLAGLNLIAPFDFTNTYRRGMETWNTPTHAEEVDKWLKINEQRILQWLVANASMQRRIIEDLA